MNLSSPEASIEDSVGPKYSYAAAGRLIIMTMRDSKEGFSMWYRRAGLVLLCVMASVMTISAATTAPPEPDQESLRRIEENLQALQQSLTDLKNRLPDETSPPLAPLTEAVRAGLENCLRANNSQVEGLIEHLHAGIDTMRSRVKWLIYINGLLVLANITALVGSWSWPRR